MKVSFVVPVITNLMDEVRVRALFNVYARLQDNIIKNINKTHYLSNMKY